MIPAGVGRPRARLWALPATTGYRWLRAIVRETPRLTPTLPFEANNGLVSPEKHCPLHSFCREPRPFDEGKHSRAGWRAQPLIGARANADGPRLDPNAAPVDRDGRGERTRADTTRVKIRDSVRQDSPADRQPA